MIIRNEGRIIERCLQSIAPICDFMTICDTGSTDDTQKVVQAFFAKHREIKGTLFQDEWKDFGHNRSLSMQRARDTGADYIVTIDADMVAQVDGFDKSQLTKDSYTAIQRLGNLYYANTRFMRASRQWRCVGVTHEYWDCQGEHSRGEITGFIIDDMGDGGCKDEKFERDIRLLTQGVKDEPKNIRYFFYLAQSYMDTGKYNEAIEWYTKRIKAGGWEQEVWYAKYMIGKCWNSIGDWPKALAAFLEAIDYNPQRSEPHYHIAQHYRAESKHTMALLWADLGLAIPFPTGSPLFCSSDVYVSRLLFEVSIVAFYRQQHLRGLVACEKLLHGPSGTQTKCLPYSTRAGKTGRLNSRELEKCLSNRLFYIGPLKTSKRQIELPVPQGWSICNPYLVSCPTPDLPSAVALLVRSVNYQLDVNTGEYTYPFGKVNTQTYCGLVSGNVLRDSAYDVGPLSSEYTKIQESESVIVPEKFPSQVEDYEDVRIVQCEGKWYGVATSREMNAATTPEMVLLHFSSGHQVIEKVVRLRGCEDDKCQKNWMPFVHQNQVWLVYQCEPLTILQPNLETGRVEIVQKTEATKWHLGNYRGGSAGVTYKDGFLFMIHEVVHKGKSRVYTHRFMYLRFSEDESWTVDSISQPFYFHDKSVEFVTGMTQVDDVLCIGVGVGDCQAWIHTLPMSDVDRYLTHGELLLR